MARGDAIAFEPGGGKPGSAPSATIADLSPSPAGTYAYPTSMTVNAKGQVSAATGGSAPSGGLTVRTVTVPHGGNIDLPGTTGDGGRIVGWSRLVTTPGGVVTGSALVSCIWDTGVSLIDSTGDQTALAYSSNGGTGLLNAEQTTSPGYVLELHYFVIGEGT